MSIPLDCPTTAPSSSLVEAMRTWSHDHPAATFAEIEVEATRQVAALRAALIRTALASREPTSAPECPTCGQAMVRNGTRTRTLTTSQTERVAITGHRYRCSVCETELFPPR